MIYRPAIWQSSKVLCLLLVVFVFSSCATTYKTATSSTTEIANTSITEHRLAVDLDIKETKVEGKFEGVNVNTDYAKNMAISDALQKNSADVLVEPYFLIETDGNKTTVTVKGYPATYRNFRALTLEDSILLGYKAPLAADTVINVIQVKTAGGGTVAPSSPNLYHSPHQVSGYQVNNSLLASQEYMKLMRRGKREIITGSAMLVSGLVLALGGRNIFERNDRIAVISVGCGLMFTGGILLPLGITNSVKAKKMSRQNNMNLALVPKINIPDRSFQLGLSLNF